MATQITADLPALDFPREVDYPTQEDWAAFSAAAEENFGILGGDWSTQMQLWKTQANAMSIELNNNADIAQSIANYQGDWSSQGYTLGQSVSVSGIYYICKLTHATGQNPTAEGSIYWNLALGNWYGNFGTGIQSFNGFGGSGFKNYIINGNFDAWQRGTSQTSNGYGSDDRWYNGNFGSSKTHSIVNCTDTERVLFNASYFSRTVVTSNVGSGNYVVKSQYIEDVTRLAGKTITISFWAKSDSNKNIAVSLSQNFGTGASPSSSIGGIGCQLIALTTTWQKKTITIALPSIVGKTLGTDGTHTSSTVLNFGFDIGSNYASEYANLGQQSGTFNIAQIQLEEGSVATPFENRPVGLELSLCQRYYEIGQVKCFIASSANGITIGNNFKVTKRIAPSMVTTGGPFQPTAYEEINPEFFRAARNIGNELSFFWSASAEL